MSNKIFLPSEKVGFWRKRLKLKTDILHQIRADAEVAVRSEAAQIVWIIEEHYKRRGVGGRDVQ